MFIGQVTKSPQRFSRICVIITRKKYQMRDSIFKPRFQIGMYYTRWKRPYIFGRIPHFDSTNYLTLISRSFSAIFTYQTFSVVWVERNVYFVRPAPWLLGQSEFELLWKRKENISKIISIFISCVRNPFGVPSFREIDFLTEDKWTALRETAT